MEHETQKQEENPANSVGRVQSITKTEIESTGDGGDSTTKTDILEVSEPSGEGGEAKALEPEEKDSVIDVGRGGGSFERSESLRGEKVCRICHLSSEISPGNSELIQLGCGCKDDLGFSHLHCAETSKKTSSALQTSFQHSFLVSSSCRQCEICGDTAKNVTGIQDTRIFMVEWNEMRLMRNTTNPSGREGTCQCRNNFCNILLACLVLAFVLPWFFRVDLL